MSNYYLNASVLFGTLPSAMFFYWWRIGLTGSIAHTTRIDEPLIQAEMRRCREKNGAIVIVCAGC
jgi:hypothetical protein